MYLIYYFIHKYIVRHFGHPGIYVLFMVVYNACARLAYVFKIR